jgi:hypothetical protein
MRIKKLILLLFVLISLNSFYQPLQINRAGHKNPVVRQINFEDDELTKQVLDENRTILFREFIAIKMQLMISDRFAPDYNTS